MVCGPLQQGQLKEDVPNFELKKCSVPACTPALACPPRANTVLCLVSDIASDSSVALAVFSTSSGMTCFLILLFFFLGNCSSKLLSSQNISSTHHSSDAEAVASWVLPETHQGAGIQKSSGLCDVGCVRRTLGLRVHLGPCLV